MDDTPAVPPKGMARPKITLQIPPPLSGRLGVPQTAGSGSTHSNPMYSTYPGFNNMQPLTPVGTAAPDQYNPFAYMYQSKASEFMFKQFEGFKDFTMNTAKSGLSVGEKSAFWMYNKISSWSKKWFTHIFLFIVCVAFTAAGAAIFVAVEGSNEKITANDIRLREIQLVEELRIMSRNAALIEDPQMWQGVALKKMEPYKEQLTEWVKQGAMVKAKNTWTFWNAMFYCGTIYTTIG